MEPTVSFFDAPRRYSYPTVETYKQLTQTVVRKAEKVAGLVTAVVNWKKRDVSGKRKLLFKLDTELRLIVFVLKKPIKPEFTDLQWKLGQALISVWQQMFELFRKISAHEISEAMYKVILSIMNRTEFQPHHTVVSDKTTPLELNCLAEEYRKMLYATYVHISDTYESYEDFLMASFQVEMKDDPMELTSELPEEDLIESASSFNNAERTNPYPFHAQEGVVAVPIMTKILFGLGELKKTATLPGRKKKQHKKKETIPKDKTTLPEDAYFNQNGLPAHFLRFAPSCLVVLYFQLPSFQELFLDHISEFPSSSNVYLPLSTTELEQAKARFPRLFAWRAFHEYIRELGIDEQEEIFDACGDTWLDLYHPGNDIFLSFYSQLVNSLFFSFLNCPISWAAVPGFTDISNVFFTEYFPPRRRHNQLAFRQTIKRLAYLSPYYLSAVTGLLLKTVNIFNKDELLRTLEFIGKIHDGYAAHNDVPSTVAYALLHPIDSDDSSDDIVKFMDDKFLDEESEHPADSTISAEELMDYFKRLIAIDHCEVILGVLSALFYIIQTACLNARRVILKVVIEELFDTLFLHWSGDVRRGFMHFVFFRSTFNRRVGLNWNNYTKEETKINERVFNTTAIDLKDFDRQVIQQVTAKEEFYKSVQSGEVQAAELGKKKTYIDDALRDLCSVQKQYASWENQTVLVPPPPVKTQIFVVDDSF